MRTAQRQSGARVARLAVIAVAVVAAIAEIPAAAGVWDETADLLLTLAELLVGVSYAGVALLAPAGLQVRAAAAATAALWVIGAFVPGASTAHQAGLAWLFVAATGGLRAPWAIAALVALGVGLVTGALPLPATVATFAAIAAWSPLRGGPRSPHGVRVATTFASGVVAVALAAAWAAQARVDGIDPRAALVAYAGALVIAAMSIAAAAWSERRRIARLREAAASAGDATGLDGLEPVLRALLHDERLRLALPSEIPAAESTKRDEPAGGTAETEVVDESGAAIARIVHRRDALGEPALRDAVADAVRLASDHDRLQSQLESQRREVARTRADLFEAAQAGRLAVAAKVDHEVLTPLRRGFLLLADLRRSDPSPDGAEVRSDPLAIALGEARLAERDLIGVIDAARARDLGNGRLAAELRALTRTGAPTVEVAADPEATADAATETALYFIASEAVSNAMKHARADRIELRLERSGDALRLEVADDGLGGVDAGGLPAVRRRVETLAGRLRIESPPGEGTRVIAVVPRPRSASTAR
ncbi:sensor histidine kinase [Agromyces tropicus]|uniref:sensor histidine kinase n=1 Tax=Agromyces tropicus TaxID=555371 RepID=UPI0031D020B6